MKAKLAAPDIRQLVTSSFERSGAHGVSRMVSEKPLYIRAMWLAIWIAFCCIFLRYIVVFAKRLGDNEVTTNFHADKVPFEYPDLYFCFDSPVSGSRHLHVDEATADQIRDSFKKTIQAMIDLCHQLSEEACNQLISDDLAEVQMNSLPYQFLTDQLGHVVEQTFFVAEMVQTNGLVFQTLELPVTEFYHPNHLRCFRTHLNETHEKDVGIAGLGDSLFFLLMVDAPDSRMGQTELPDVLTPTSNLTAPYWALAKQTLSSRIRGSMLRVYVTRPGHYPSEFDNVLLLEAGRAYDVQLVMREQVHREDPTSCIDQHPNVAVVNPFDNSAYSVAYDYAYCYHRAVQDQLRRELNATLAYLPHPWPPGDRSLYNLSSGWGSIEDVRSYLTSKAGQHAEEPHLRCARAKLCVQRVYVDTIDSVQWSSAESLDRIFDNTRILDDEYFPDAPALRYLRELAASRDSGNSSSSRQMAEYIRANFLQLQLRAKKPAGDQIIFTPAYSFESFVADVGGVMGILLGMSLLTVCELLEFLHDLLMIVWPGRQGSTGSSAEQAAASAAAAEAVSRPVEFRAMHHRLSTMPT